MLDLLKTAMVIIIWIIIIRISLAVLFGVIRTLINGVEDDNYQPGTMADDSDMSWYPD